jgi:DNA polymerase III delta subunit
MPAASPQAVRSQIAQRKPDPIYLIVGDDEAEMSRLAGELSGLVEDELRAFNLERLYAGERGGTPADIVASARTLPMMGDRRVIVVLRAEKILKPKRRGRTALEEEEPPDVAETGAAAELEAYVVKPEPQTTLVFVASDVDRSRRLYRSLQKQATIVECWGLRPAKDARVDLRQVGLALESGAVPYMILGQLGWFVREKLVLADARRVPAAVDALFRTDLDLKSSGGDPRVLLERLVVDLCRR